MTKKPNQITFLDFFAGIGGFRTAVERLGGKCLGFAEIDKHARQSYKALYNTEGEREWHDIMQVTDREFAELVGQVDLINAGFPCQAFSVAGKRQGFEDSRGTLFYEVARAAKAIRPKYILLENVKGLLSHDKGNTVDVIFRTLNEIGYTIDFKHGVLIAQQEATRPGDAVIKSQFGFVGIGHHPFSKKQEFSGFHDDVSPCLIATDYKAPKCILENYLSYRIRKLTPLECWRLQGFSDEQHQKAVDAGVSNSQRYKQAGNSVTVNVIEAVVTQLIALDHTNQNESTEVA